MIPVCLPAILGVQEVITHSTVCPGSSDPFYIASLLYKMGHYCLDILYIVLIVPKFKHKSVLHLLKYTTNLYCTADAVQLCGNFWDTQIRE